MKRILLGLKCGLFLSLIFSTPALAADHPEITPPWDIYVTVEGRGPANVTFNQGLCNPLPPRIYISTPGRDDSGGF